MVLKAVGVKNMNFLRHENGGCMKMKVNVKIGSGVR